MSATVYETVTTTILESLGKGVVPWRKPWFDAPLPTNAVSQKAYRGVNMFLLALSPYRDHRWLTFKQATEMGGTVKRGERSTEIIFWKTLNTTKGDEEGEEPRRRSVPLLKSYRVFNAEQCEGLRLMPPAERVTLEHQRIAEAEELIRLMPDPPRFEDRHRSAWYRPADDLIGMPPITAFRSADAYYATRFHELGHATGHEKRLNRSEVSGVIEFGSETYGMEELVAELTSSFCAAIVGLDSSLLGASASYIESWIKTLKGNPKMVVIAAARAQKAAEFIRGI
jgi:antirestriction protein ArdC